MARLSSIIGNETIEESDVVPVLDASGLFGKVETAMFAFEQVLDRDGLLDLVLSRSYLAKLPPPEREPVLDAVAALYDESATDEGVRLTYVTECFRAERRQADWAPRRSRCLQGSSRVRIRASADSELAHHENSRLTASMLLPSGSSTKAA